MKKRIYIYIVTILMVFQIVFGIVWMLKNYMCIPAFGDSSEYIELSQTLVLDEYRPILYPLFLRYILMLGETIKIPYQIILYTIQSVISYLALFYCIGQIYIYTDVAGKRHIKNSVIWRLFISGFCWTIPMVTYMNFSVLTDSLATSFLVLFLTGMIGLFYATNIPVKSVVIVIVSVIIESLLRADRLYTCLVLLLGFGICKIVQNKKMRMQWIVILAIMSMSSVCVVKGVDKLTQTPGCYGRITTNFEFVLLDRIVWPNMATNYDDFSDEIKQIITLDDAKKFDEHNNNVMYQMAPLVESKVGKVEARRVYKEMAWVVLRNGPLKVLGEIGEDIFAMAATPVSSLMNEKGYCEKGDSWNIQCMSTKTPTLTAYYNLYGLYLFLLLLVIAVWIVVKVDFRSMKQFGKVLMPFIVMSLVLTLWFSLGDGAPPNDRYAIIIYITWELLVVGIVLGKGERKNPEVY